MLITSNPIFNFSSGPAAMPQSVLRKAQCEMLSIGDAGRSVMEISHRSPTFQGLLRKAQAGIRELLEVPQNYHILFLQGGATLQFSMIPMNLLGAGQESEYVLTGVWGKKALMAGAKIGRVTTLFSSENTGFHSIPEVEKLAASETAAYLHYTSNETIHGVQFDYELTGNGTPVVCDMSSDIMSRPVNVSNFGLIYAGAQKNLGPSGVTVVIVRDDLLERIPDGLPSVLDYRMQVQNDSMVNTPNTWGIYMIGLVCDWLRERGGVKAMEILNRQKAAFVYDVIDSSDGYYRGMADRAARSQMNITFRLADEKLEERFCFEAADAGLVELRGHRSVGGIRASLYNALPTDGAVALAEFMRDFATRNG